MPAAVMDRELLLRIERAAFHAWPAVETADLGGWAWRFSDGGSQRANSVSALHFTESNVESTIDEVERRYAALEAPPQFQVSDVSSPSDLDAHLARRGYTINDPCVTLVKTLGTDSSPPAGTDCSDSPSIGWFTCYSSVITPARQMTAPRILASIPRPRVFCGYMRDSRIVATALGVPLDGIIIAECVATHAEARGTGAASNVMRALEVWGAARGCQYAALQAVTTNAPAQALYKRLGYMPIGRYHMRVKRGPAKVKQ